MDRTQQARRMERKQRVVASRDEPGMVALLEHLEERLKLATAELVDASDAVQIHRLQGSVKTCEDLLRYITEPTREIK